MNKSQYNAPSMEVVELGDKDIVCTSPGMHWGVTDSNGNLIGGGGIKNEGDGDLSGEITG